MNPLKLWLLKLYLAYLQSCYVRRCNRLGSFQARTLNADAQRIDDLLDRLAPFDPSITPLRLLR